MDRPPWDWLEDDLLRLISDRVGESFELEYKQSAALQHEDRAKNELSKDVAALANSGGGSLVYGIRESGHVPIELDAGFDPLGPITKEWVENVITSRIHPRVDGLRIGVVDLTRTHRGRVAYVIHVPQSTRAPHQSADKRYYKRHNFKAEPMEDYEVRDVMRRGDVPVVDARLLLRCSYPALQAHIAALLTNAADEPAEYAHTVVGVDPPAEAFSCHGIHRSSGEPSRRIPCESHSS